MSDRIRYILTDPDGTPFVPLAEVDTAEYTGTTLREFMNIVEWDRKFQLPTICVIDGEPIPRQDWDTRIVTSMRDIEVWSRPGLSGSSGTGTGGGANSKQGLNVSIGVLVAMIAATALLAWAAPMLAGSLGVGAGVIKAIGGVLIAAGGMLLMQFLMPKAGAKSDPAAETIYSIGREGNLAAPLEPIPVGYGRMMREPNLAADPFTEYVGKGQILYELFCIGCGEYDIENVYINDTLVYANGAVTGPFSGMQIQILGPNEPLTLFYPHVTTSSEVAGISLDDSTFIGPFAANPSGTLANTIMIDLVWPSGAFAVRKEKQYAVITPIECWIEEIDDAGGPISAPQLLFNRTYSNSSKVEIRVTEKIPVAAGRYAVKLRRTNMPLTKSTLPENVTAQDDVTWSAVRAVIGGPTQFPDVTLMAMLVPAADQISALSARKWGVIATRKIPTWDPDTEAFTAPIPTRNPIDVALDIWVNDVYSAGLPIGNVELDTLMSYRDYFDTTEQTFDHFFKSQQTIYEALETVLKVVKCIPAFVGDKFTVVRDEPKAVRQLFTDREIIRGTLSIHRRLADEELADGVTVQYIDERTWNLAEVSSGTSLVNPAVVQMDGIVQRAQAYDIALYLDAVNRYRRRAVTFDIELEGRMLRRGDLVAVQSSIPRSWGTASYALSYVSGTRTMVVGNDLPWNVSGDHWIEIRTPTGGIWGPVKVTKGTGNRTIIVDATDLAAVELEFGAITAALARSGPTMEEPSIAFAPGSKRTFRGLVQGASFRGSRATINLIIAALQPYEIPTEVTGFTLIPWGGTLNVLDKGPEITLSNGALTAQRTVANMPGDWTTVRSTRYRTPGDNPGSGFVYEYKNDVLSSFAPWWGGPGFSTEAHGLGSSLAEVDWGGDIHSVMFSMDGWYYFVEHVGALAPTLPVGEWVAIAIRMDLMKVWKGNNAGGIWKPDGDPALGTGGFSISDIVGTRLYAAWHSRFLNQKGTFNFSGPFVNMDLPYMPTNITPVDPTFDPPDDLTPKILGLTGTVTLVDPDWVLTADWLDVTGADEYQLQISYDDTATWADLAVGLVVSGWTGNITPFEGFAYIRARAHTPSFGYGPWSNPVAVNQPFETIPVDDVVDLQDRVDALEDRLDNLRLDDLIDVMSEGAYFPADGAILTYDATLRQWIPDAVSTHKAASMALETDIAFPITSRKERKVGIGMATETDTAFSILIRPKRRMVNTATETDTAQVIVPGQTPLNLTPPEIYVV